jgi:Fe-S-cluster containining protein
LTQFPIITAADCRGCGACCYGLVVPPFDVNDDTDAEFNALPEELQREINAAWDAACDADGHLRSSPPCCWLDVETNTCRNYEHRPAVCREFEPGCYECHEFRREYEDDQETHENEKEN